MTLPNNQDLVEVLLAALERPEERLQLISQFQQKLWHTEEELPRSAEWEIFRDLAYDLDYYDPNSKSRSEDPAFYDDQRLEEEIGRALNKLELGGHYKAK